MNRFIPSMIVLLMWACSSDVSVDKTDTRGADVPEAVAEDTTGEEEDNIGDDGRQPATGFCNKAGDGSWCDGDFLVTCLAGEEMARIPCDAGCFAAAPGLPAACQSPGGTYCKDKSDGTWCDGHQLVTCNGTEEMQRVSCPAGCIWGGSDGTDLCEAEVEGEGFCLGKTDGDWCDNNVLVTCASGFVNTWVQCLDGCLVNPPGQDDQCAQQAQGFCTGKAEGMWCDGNLLVTCSGEVVATWLECPQGCQQMGSAGTDQCKSETQEDFCQDKMNGDWCMGNDLVKCKNDQIASQMNCPGGCLSMPLGTADKCNDTQFCMAIPPMESPQPPTQVCSYMDWHMSPDGFYLISQFGTSNDQTTWGGTTSCGYLQGHYNYHDCIYDNHGGGCQPGDHDIPWIRGDVDYSYDQVISLVAQNMNGDVPEPDYFYVADAQRFGCGAVLRVSYPQNSRCIVVYTEDGGPGSKYEKADKGGRRILDCSPAVLKYLQVKHAGWLNSDLVLVEWGLPGDVPGQQCTPCQSDPVQQGTEGSMPIWKVSHMMPSLCE